LYSQATTPELRNTPLGLSFTQPKSVTAEVKVTLKADCVLTSTLEFTVGNDVADVRSWKTAGHKVRFATPVLPVVPWVTS
jgi:hypothetical protein